MKWGKQLSLIKQTDEYESTLYSVFICAHVGERKLLGIINGDFYATGQQMIIYSALVKYLKIMGI
jgi:hypothetical protein